MKVRHILQCMTFLCCARWVSRHLSEGHKCNCQHNCCSLLEWCNHKSDNFLNCIITGVETWVRRHEPETKWWSMQRKHKSSSKKSKSHPSTSRLLLTVFWDFQEPIREHYMDRDITVISVNYCNILGNGLRRAVCTKLRGGLS